MRPILALLPILILTAPATARAEEAPPAPVESSEGAPPVDQAEVAAAVADWQAMHATPLGELRRLSREGDDPEDVERFMQLRGALLRSVVTPVMGELGIEAPEEGFDTRGALDLVNQLLRRLPAGALPALPGSEDPSPGDFGP